MYILDPQSLTQANYPFGRGILYKLAEIDE